MNKCVAAAADGNVRNYTVAGNSAAVADDDGLWKEAKDMSQEYKEGGGVELDHVLPLLRLLSQETRRRKEEEEEEQVLILL